MIKKILVVDNNKVVLRLMAHMLEEMGYAVRTAVDGLSAIDVIADFKADVIFVDLVMPKISGEKFCRILRSMPEQQHTYIVIFSAIAAEEQVNYQDFGADACIAKGPLKELREHVQTVLGRAAGVKRQSSVSNEIIGSDRIFEREITKELLSSKRHLEVALNRISDAFLELTPEGKVVYANSAACRLTGLVEEKLLSFLFVDLFSKEQRASIQKLLTHIGFDLLSVGEDEPIFIGESQILLDMAAVDELGQRFIVVVLRDITQRKQVEQQLKHQQENLEKQVAERTVALIEANAKLQRDIVERQRLYEQKEELIRELQDALAKVKTLSGFLPICASCKKIRDDKGYWQQLEAYLGKHSSAEFSHSICPECLKSLYPELDEE
ncbi:MAG: response regulator [Pseudomonadota bacterium]